MLSDYQVAPPSPLIVEIELDDEEKMMMSFSSTPINFKKKKGGKG